MFKSPFPPCISFVTCDQRLGRQVKLDAQEAAQLPKGASPKRKEQFKLGRLAAKFALEQLGVTPPPPILIGDDGDPIWPPNIVGSISHAEGLAVSALGFLNEVKALGIDLERADRELSIDISTRICTAQEKIWVDEAATEEERRLRTMMIFSGKESIFKALYPIVRRHFGFKAVVLTWQQNIQAFEAKINNEHSKNTGHSSLTVGCLIKKPYILTYAWLGADAYQDLIHFAQMLSPKKVMLH